MHVDGKKMLNLMFRPEETICVSNSKFGYHSIPLENTMSGEVGLLPVLEANKTWEEQIIYCDSFDLSLVALNPISGYRRDINVKAFRNFLVELDIGTIPEQMEYIKRSGLPYSAMIFSGSKSVHTLISLNADIPNEQTYRKVASWILNILPLADQNIKNPSRSIRIPGAERSPGKFQELLEFNGTVSLDELAAWLEKHPSAKPKDVKKRKKSDKADITQIPTWVAKRLKEGFPAGLGRNAGWFQLSCEFYNAGFNEDQTIEIFEQYFEEEHDFKEREWLLAINSAFKHKTQK